MREQQKSVNLRLDLEKVIKVYNEKNFAHEDPEKRKATLLKLGAWCDCTQPTLSAYKKTLPPTVNIINKIMELTGLSYEEVVIEVESKK
jgi:antitoxin component HigA of HigAB toxin-antitoxin module